MIRKTKPKPGRYAREKILERLIEVLGDEWEIIDPKSCDRPSTYIVLRKSVLQNLFLYIYSGISEKNNLILLIGWSHDRSSTNIERAYGHSTQIDEIIKTRGCPEFQEDSRLFGAAELKRKPGQRPNKKPMPQVVSAFHFERVKPRIDKMVESVISDLKNLALPYFELLIAYKSKNI